MPGLAYVVTGAGRGVGRAVAERLLADGHGVVAVEHDAAAVTWLEHSAAARAVIGDAADEAVAERAADHAQAAGTLAGWVNNAAVFRDASLHSSEPRTVLDLVATNLAPVVVGCSTAVRRFLAAGTPGTIVNVSSHQAQRPVPGCAPYAAAKAAIEGLTRALAVEYGPRGIRANAVALGTVATERYDAARHDAEMARLHPLGRVAQPTEAAAAIVHLLSREASFITGATVPVDGGRAVLGHDPEAHPPP
jgi:NAD(P)-dependent dehydrogenase (short-subunit alcohol dehydrogenase family)